MSVACSSNLHSESSLQFSDTLRTISQSLVIHTALKQIDLWKWLRERSLLPPRVETRCHTCTRETRSAKFVYRTGRKISRAPPTRYSQENGSSTQSVLFAGNTHMLFNRQRFFHSLDHTIHIRLGDSISLNNVPKILLISSFIDCNIFQSDIVFHSKNTSRFSNSSRFLVFHISGNLILCSVLPKCHLQSVFFLQQTNQRRDAWSNRYIRGTWRMCWIRSSWISYFRGIVTWKMPFVLVSCQDCSTFVFSLPRSRSHQQMAWNTWRSPFLRQFLWKIWRMGSSPPMLYGLDLGQSFDRRAGLGNP